MPERGEVLPQPRDVLLVCVRALGRARQVCLVAQDAVERADVVQVAQPPDPVQVDERVVRHIQVQEAAAHLLAAELAVQRGEPKARVPAEHRRRGGGLQRHGPFGVLAVILMHPTEACVKLGKWAVLGISVVVPRERLELVRALVRCVCVHGAQRLVARHKLVQQLGRRQLPLEVQPVRA